MLPVHLLALGFVLGVSAIADKDALSWVRGTQATLDHTKLRTYHMLVWVGLLTLIVSGLFLFYPMRASLLGDLLFDIKLLFVVILCVNAVLIGRLTEHATSQPFAMLGGAERRALFASGAISLFSWVVAAGIAFLLFA